MKLESWRKVKGKITCQVRYAITSLGPQTPAARLLELARGHWGIENRLRYVRDVTMGEESSQARADSAPQMMAAVRNLALNILRLCGERNIAAAIRKIGLGAQRRSTIARIDVMTIIERLCTSPDRCHHQPAEGCRILPSDPDSTPQDEAPSRSLSFRLRLGLPFMSDAISLMQDIVPGSAVEHGNTGPGCSIRSRAMNRGSEQWSAIPNGLLN